MSSTHPSPTLPQPLRWLTTPSSSLAGTVDLPLAELGAAQRSRTDGVQELTPLGEALVDALDRRLDEHLPVAM